MRGDKPVPDIRAHRAYVAKASRDVIRVGFLGAEGFYREFNGGQAVDEAVLFILTHNATLDSPIMGAEDSK